MCNYKSLKIIIAIITILTKIVEIHGQQHDRVQDVIDEVFGTIRPINFKEKSSQIKNNNDNNEECTCVPYYNCLSNNTINTSGYHVIDVRLDFNSCNDVLKKCCKNDEIKSKSSTNTNVINIIKNPNTAKGCGIRNVRGVDFRISGNYNNEAEFGEFPWMVAIIKVYDNECICGGSLIHPHVVLTGNHCVKKYNASELKARAGEWDTQSVSEPLPFQEELVQSIISHPDYDPLFLENDIALLVMQQPFKLAHHINTICLPPRDYDWNEQQYCYATGWGKDVFGKAGKYSVIMKRVILPIVRSDKCEAILQQTRLGPFFKLGPSHICAGGEVGVDTCEGDGGAPLVCPVGNPLHNRYSQAGMVAWGIGCNENRPAVYANIAAARYWIDTQMVRLGFDPSIYISK